MSLKETIETNKGVMIIVVLGVLMVAGCGKSSGTGPAPRWYYDLETGDQVPFSSTQRSPVTLENGHSAVRAYVYGCGNCNGETFLSYIERFAPDAPPLPTEKPKGPIDINVGREYALKPQTAGGQVNWVSHNSQEAQNILNGPRNQCVNSAPKICMPER